MNDETIVRQVANQFVAQAAKDRESQPKSAPVPQDLYQEQARAIKKMPPRMLGGTGRALVDLSVLQSNVLQSAYKRAEAESRGWEKQGDRERARLIREGYMQDSFLPAVDALVGRNGREAILANADVLSQLDDLTLIEGGASQGYTKALILALYQPSEPAEMSDSYVRYNIGKIRYLCAEGQIRAAMDIASRLRNDIDNGTHLASPEDYEIIETVLFKSR